MSFLAPRPRPAFAAIDALLALIVVGVGVLALAGVATVAMTHADDGATRDRAAMAARRVIDSLLATPCASLASGASTPSAGVSIRWSVGDTGDVRAISESVLVSLRGTPRTIDYAQVIGCRAP